jgi:hypothetical protein
MPAADDLDLGHFRRHALTDLLPHRCAMFGHAESWPHVVEIELPRERFAGKLRDIETWLQGWQIPHRVGSTLGETGILRVRFAELKFARAFQFHHGGMILPDDEDETAMRDDENDQAEYQRLADEQKR